MARPNKEGLDYFPLDTNIDQDDKIALIEATHGIVGFGLIIKLFKKIYANKGYYYEWNEQTQLLFSKQIGVDFNQIIEIVNNALKWDLFDKKLFKKYKILTSKRIQMTYIEATKRRKEVPMLQKYLLKGVNGYINKINANIISINDDNSTQTETETETETEMKQYNVLIDVFNYWNSKKIINHKMMTETIGDKIQAKINNGYTVEEIKQAIHNYSTILTGEEYYFNYKWTLINFLGRASGFEIFKDADVAHENYLIKDDKYGNRANPR